MEPATFKLESGRGGPGVIVARTRRGWSGPSSIGTGGVGFGFQIGAEETEFIYFLNTCEAVEHSLMEETCSSKGDISRLPVSWAALPRGM